MSDRHPGSKTPKSTAFRGWAWLWAPLLLMATPLFAQAPGMTPSPAQAAPLGGGENRELTIAKCLADRKSPDADVRLRAVMILGKYPDDPRVVNALVASLADTEATVRRAAVVSLAEIGSFPPQAANALLKNLADPDVQVRRLISARLNDLVIPLRLQGLRTQADDGAHTRFALPPDTRQVIVNAFADEDQLVRKNMLAGEGLLRDAIPVDAIRPLLADPAPETRALAIAAVRSRLPETFVETVAPLVDDPDVHVRRALARAVARERTEAAVALLRTLSDDEDGMVAVMAAEGLFLQRQAIPKERFLALLESRDVAGNLAGRLISLYATLGQEAVEALVQLTGHQQAAYRAAALIALAQTPGAIEAEQALSFFADPSLEVRRATQRIVHGEQAPTRDSLDRLLHSPYEDVRQFVLLLSRRLPPDEAEELLQDLLLDEHVAVRKQTLAEYARRKLPGALEMLSLSLEDNHYEIQEAAIVGLYRLADVEAHRRLRAFAEKTDNPDLKKLIGLLLTERAQPPPQPQLNPPHPQPAQPVRKP